ARLSQGVADATAPRSMTARLPIMGVLLPACSMGGLSFGCNRIFSRRTACSESAVWTAIGLESAVDDDHGDAEHGNHGPLASRDFLRFQDHALQLGRQLARRRSPAAEEASGAGRGTGVRRDLGARLRR